MALCVHRLLGITGPSSHEGSCATYGLCRRLLLCALRCPHAPQGGLAQALERCNSNKRLNGVMGGGLCGCVAELLKYKHHHFLATTSVILRRRVQ